jgi:hypothetical protein
MPDTLLVQSKRGVRHLPLEKRFNKEHAIRGWILHGLYGDIL